MRSELPPYFELLGDQLVDAARRRNEQASFLGRLRSIDWHPIRLVIATIALVVAISLSNLFVNDTANAITIRHIKDEIQISMTDSAPDPSKLQEELRAVGIDATVTPVPVGPPLVGHFVGYSQTASGKVELVDANEDGAFEMVVLSSEFDESVEFYYGREAQPGEAYQAGAPPFRCEDLINRRVAEVLSALVDEWPSIRWQRGGHESKGVTEIPFSQLNLEVDYVVGLTALSAEEVLVLVTEEPQLFGLAFPC